jgi:hypothetical protein
MTPEIQQCAAVARTGSRQWGICSLSRTNAGRCRFFWDLQHDIKP